MSLAKNTRASVIPCLRYRDAAAAIDWLCAVFGFETHMVVSNLDGSVAHAELSFGNGMVMLASVKDSAFDRMMTQPDQTGGAETQCPYLVVSDADAVYKRATAAGAQIC
jgi:uncharacterized glyoxalase superfamily protein PhnB